MDGRRFIDSIFASEKTRAITQVVMNLPNDAAEFLGTLSFCNVLNLKVLIVVGVSLSIKFSIVSTKDVVWFSWENVPSASSLFNLFLL